MSEQALIRTAIAACDFLNAHEKLDLDRLVSSLQFFRSLSIGTLCRITGRRLQSVTWDADQAIAAAERHLAFCHSRSVQLVSYFDDAYPPALREIFDPPFLLFVRGRLPDPGVPVLAIVGTRSPTQAALDAATRLGEEVAENGLPVVSGLARGIDVAAHRGALSARGVTGAVLACGIDSVCPSSHRGIAASILSSGGFLVSEYPPGTAAQKYRFPARNRIISGLSRGVVVVQAPAKSGALITADYALDQGRDLYVHAAGTVGERGEGTRALAADGALSVDGAGGILSDWGLTDRRNTSVGEQAGVFAGAWLAKDLRCGTAVGMMLAEAMREEASRRPIVGGNNE